VVLRGLTNPEVSAGVSLERQSPLIPKSANGFLALFRRFRGREAALRCISPPFLLDSRYNDMNASVQPITTPPRRRDLPQTKPRRVCIQGELFDNPVGVTQKHNVAPDRKRRRPRHQQSQLPHGRRVKPRQWRRQPQVLRISDAVNTLHAPPPSRVSSPATLAAPQWTKLAGVVDLWYSRCTMTSAAILPPNTHAQAVATFAQLANWAIPCLEVINAPHGISVPMGSKNSGRSGAATKAGQLRCESDALSFLRCLAQCTELSLRLCLDQLRASVANHLEQRRQGNLRQEKQTSSSSSGSVDDDDLVAEKQSQALEADVLGPMRASLWHIMAAIEPKLFWDPRPFWCTQHLGSLWAIYVRLMLLVCFDQYPILKARAAKSSCWSWAGQQQQQHRAQAYTARHGRRPMCTMADFGLSGRNVGGVHADDDDGDDDDGLGLPHEGDAENWSMTELFEVIDVLTDRWPLVRYERPVVQLVTRILLRYANLGYAISETECVPVPADDGADDDDDDDDGTRRDQPEYAMPSAHDMEEYVTERYEAANTGDGDQLWGLGRCVRCVREDTYYGDGGAALREMLSDFLVATQADGWMWVLSAVNTTNGGRMYTDVTAMGTSARRALGSIPLARRLWISLQNASDTDAVKNPLMWLCETSGLLNDSLTRVTSTTSAATLSDSQGPLPRHELDEASDACLSEVALFLKDRDSEEPYRVFARSGAVLLLRPGETWRFRHRWPRHGCTPLNILNGMRDGDMMRYNEMVTQSTMPHELASKPDRALPGDLVTLLDHLSIECVRYMMRKCCTDKATDALNPYIVVKHQISTGWSTRCPTPWDDDIPWCFRLSAVAHSDGDAYIPWEERAIERLVAGAITDMALPPWPKIIQMGGRVVIWNPMGPLCRRILCQEVDPSDSDSDANANTSVEGGAGETGLEPHIVDRMCAEVLDLSDVAMSGTLVVWLEAKILITDIMRRGVMDAADSIVARTGARPGVSRRNRTGSRLDQINELLGIVNARMDGYRQLMQRLVGSLRTAK